MLEEMAWKKCTNYKRVRHSSEGDHSKYTMQRCPPEVMPSHSEVTNRHLSEADISVSLSPVLQALERIQRRRPKLRPRDLDISDSRERTYSLPSTPRHVALNPERRLQSNENGDDGVVDDYDEDDDVYPEPRLWRLRSFSKTSKGGLVNRGDSVRKRTRTGSSNSDSSGNVFLDGADCDFKNYITWKDFTRTRTSSGTSQCSNVTTSSSNESSSVCCFRAAILGANGVGKSALMRQFMTSEYLGGMDLSKGDDENVVSVLLDTDESTIDFVNATDIKEITEIDSIDGYMVVFEVTDRWTFQTAVDMLFQLRREHIIGKPVIFVANKTDLVRRRQVSGAEARSVALQYRCKYLETSAAINHNVDELLVGMVTQLRLKMDSESGFLRKSGQRKHSCVSSLAKGILGRLKGQNDAMCKSCDSLFTL